ncbi:MAG: ADP-ribosylglycohydrolase family protein [Planctomycetota bacterium]|jgi:hypothetical protein
MRSTYRLAIALLLLLPTLVTAGDRQLSKADYTDKCKGAWVGQMVGVQYGVPYEFKYWGNPILKELRPWVENRIGAALGQDDCYVEMTFLASLEKHGLDITYEEAGKDFADSQYGLAHANFWGRNNVRKGIMPPMSGHPKYNRHADDIDFQIEADLLGIIAPGMPQESNRLCDIFGHIMNYGDGVYGGMFVAGMYSSAYFEDKDILKVIKDGLACIPAESQYHQCISDVIKWYHETPDDWLANWMKIEDKWNDNIDCRIDHKFNIDAKLNGAYVVMGLLYGKGDFLKTMEIATRCGQDADCNASSAAGVLGCMLGFDALGSHYTGGITRIADKKFSHTKHSFNTLIPACQKMTEKIIRATGGKVNENQYLIKRQAPKPARLEQWENQMELLRIAVPQYEVDLWEPNWKLLYCGHETGPSYRTHYQGRKNCLHLHPISHLEPAVLVTEKKIPNTKQPKIYVDVAPYQKGNFRLKILINDQVISDTLIDTKGKWIQINADLTPYAGKKVYLRLEFWAPTYGYNLVYLDKVEIK